MQYLRRLLLPPPKPSPPLTARDEAHLLLAFAVLVVAAFAVNLLYAAGMLLYDAGRVVWG